MAHYVYITHIAIFISYADCLRQKQEKQKALIQKERQNAEGKSLTTQYLLPRAHA